MTFWDWLLVLLYMVVPIPLEGETKYNQIVYSIFPWNNLSIKHWNVAGAPLNPKGITLNWYNPKGVIKVVSGCDSHVATGTCHYPLPRSGIMPYPTGQLLVNVWHWVSIHLCHRI